MTHHPFAQSSAPLDTDHRLNVLGKISFQKSGVIIHTVRYKNERGVLENGSPKQNRSQLVKLTSSYLVQTNFDAKMPRPGAPSERFHEQKNKKNGKPHPLIGKNKHKQTEKGHRTSQKYADRKPSIYAHEKSRTYLPFGHAAGVKYLLLLHHPHLPSAKKQKKKQAYIV